jgi:glycerate kinase
VLLAPDSFKGTLSAATVAAALAAGVRAAGGVPLVCPVADGGEGTAEVLADALGGRRPVLSVTGPLGAPVPGWFLLTDDGTAVLDTATASGLQLVPPAERDAYRASTIGTGELVAAAVAAGATRVLLGVGGSATTDGGAGALAALPAGLGRATLTVLCDVRTPYEDAAVVFAPQKGADAGTVRRLTARLHRLAAELPRDPRGRPFTGAAGGLAGGLWAAHDARLVSGIDAVLDLVGFDARAAGADVVITGEGRLDGQTREGKAVAGVTRRAAALGVPAWAVVGQSTVDGATTGALGLAGVLEAGTGADLRAAAAEITRRVAANGTATAHPRRSTP